MADQTGCAERVDSFSKFLPMWNIERCFSARIREIAKDSKNKQNEVIMSCEKLLFSLN